MSKKTARDILLTMSMISSGEYEGYFPSDERVMECIWDMYFYMLYNGIGNEEKKEEYFNEFGKKYNNLNKEQQEEVKKEFNDIIEAQNEEKEKVKKKGMINYE